jgi:hypothetical protein
MVILRVWGNKNEPADVRMIASNINPPQENKVGG